MASDAPHGRSAGIARTRAMRKDMSFIGRVSGSCSFRDERPGARPREAGPAL